MIYEDLIVKLSIINKDATHHIIVEEPTWSRSRERDGVFH